MDRKLTEADLATYLIEIAAGAAGKETQTRTVRAAYDIPEPGWLVFKDHLHRGVARFNENLVIGVTRTDDADYADPSDEDRIRDAMTEAHDHPGRTITR
jgi:hypothetical protein